MATRKTTRYWKENKPVYPLCLCYSQEKGLYTKRLTENESCDELLYRPHGYVGEVNEKRCIPGQDIEIEFQSNFDYRNSKSYLRALIKKNNRSILDFDLAKMFILRNCSIQYQDVPVYDWDALFEKIIKAYNRASLDEYTTSSIGYLEELNMMLDKSEIIIKGDYSEEQESHWKGVFSVILFASNKIRDFLKGYEDAQIADSTVQKQTHNLLLKYVYKVKSMDLDYSDSRVSQISETMMLIHKFMCENKAGTEYLSMILDKEV